MSNSRFGLRTRQGEVKGIVQGLSAGLILDVYINSAAAYSLRKLRTAYTGSAIRVRRSNDNAEQDIGFNGFNLDTSALTTFCGANNGFVTTWYDQSGNGRNATQTTSANQPQIVSSGSIILDNTKPCISWTTSSRMVNASFNPSSSEGFSSFNVYSTTNAAAANTNTMFLYSFGQTSGDNYFAKFSSTAIIAGEFICFSKKLGRLGSSSYRRTANTQVLESDFYLSSGFNFYKNTAIQSMDISSGVSVTDNWSPSQISLTGGMFLNSFVNSGDSVNCKMQEVIFYDNSQLSNRTGIESNINAYYGIY